MNPLAYGDMPIPAEVRDVVADSNDDGTVQLTCACGFETPLRYTWEAAGRDLDVHLAERFPRGTERKAHNCTAEVAA